jgi:hypothetical protein
MTGEGPRVDERGFGMIGLALSLVAVALLSVGALAAFGGGQPTTAEKGALGTSVANAYDVGTQTNLANAMQNVRSALIADGDASATDLTQFGVTTGASTTPGAVSGAVAHSTDGDATGSASGLGSDAGTVTLAASSRSGTCWFIWFSDSATWYGTEPDATSCVAQAMAAAPTPVRASPGSIGWQQGAFPVTG